MEKVDIITQTEIFTTVIEKMIKQMVKENTLIRMGKSTKVTGKIMHNTEKERKLTPMGLHL
jgi:hypothetical protein